MQGNVSCNIMSKTVAADRAGEAAMRPLEEKSFDPHDPIDLDDGRRVSELASRLQVTPDDIAEAVVEVGPNPTAVAIYLLRGLEL